MNAKLAQALRSKKNARVLFTATQLALDVAMNVLAFYVAYRLRLLTEHKDFGTLWDNLPMLNTQVVVMVLVFLFFRLYNHQRARSSFDEVYGVFVSVLIGILITISITLLLFRSGWELPRLMILYDAILTFVFVSVARAIHGRLVWYLRKHGVDEERLLLVGTTEVGRMIQQKILHSPGMGYHVVGYIADRDDCPKMVLGCRVLGKIEDIPAIIQQEGVDEVIVALPEATRRQLLDIVYLCELGGKVSIKVFPDVFQIMASEVSIGVLDGLPLLTIHDPAMQGWRFYIKRVMDMLLSALGLVVLSPFLIFTALLIKLDSPGPAFYFQERMGLDAKPFAMIKFRSMRQDAESRGPGWTTEDDPRRTRLGTIIRKLSIDEFPQLINVLLGDMSLVGPRPERPMYVEQFRRNIPRYMDRHREKAGITGWAQVNGLRGDTSIAERTKYDLWYVENWSLLLDLKIIIRTLTRVFTDRQAY